NPEQQRLETCMRALFVESNSSMGSRRIARRLQAQGFAAGRDRGRRPMKKLGLVVKKKRKFRITTNSNHKLPVAENILDRQFNPVTQNQAWAADITYIWTAEGWLYLAVVIDLYSRRVVGWCMDKRQTKSLVIRALMMAVNMRKPSAGLIHHSDRGSQYASLKYQASLNQAWAADITYIWTAEGWLYLAVVIDLYSRRVVGWCMDKRQTKSLVIRALMMAVNMRKPSAGLIHHSDRGSQYASLKYQASLK